MKSKRPLGGPTQDSRRIVINDSSCLIDLWKARLLRQMLALPHHFAVALPVQRDEMLDISQAEWNALIVDGLGVVDLDPSQTARAFGIKAEHASLSAVDCFSLALACSFPNTILLTSDAKLRRVCETIYRVEAHGVLWIADELMRHDSLPKSRLRQVLELWRDDPTVFVPHNMIAARLKRLSEM